MKLSKIINDIHSQLHVVTNEIENGFLSGVVDEKEKTNIFNAMLLLEMVEVRCINIGDKEILINDYESNIQTNVKTRQK